MARNASSKKAKKAEPEYTLGYDAEGNVVLVPVTPDTAPTSSPFSRIGEGAMEGYGYQPLGMSEETIAKYPATAQYLNPVAKALDAVRRAPGAIAGGLAGAAGTGAELLTGDRGVANEAERATRSALEYFGSQGAATMGGPRPRKAAVNGEIFPPERGAPRQLGYTERPPVDVYRELPPGSIRGTSAERAPRLQYEDPLTQYRLASEQGQRIGPRRPPERMIDEMYTLPEQINRAPEVRTEPTAAQRLSAESPMADRALAARQQAGRDAEAAFRQRQAAIAEEEGFGRPMTQSDKDFAQFQRELAAAEDRGAGAQFAPPAGAGEPRSPLLDMPAPGIKRRPAPPVEPVAPAAPQFNFGGPQPATGSFSPVTRAEALVPEPVNLDAMLGRPSTAQGNAQRAIDLAKERSDTMRRSAADASGQQAAIDAAAQRVAAERAANPNAMIDQAIADATGQPSVLKRPMGLTLKKQPPTSSTLSAEEIDLLRKNGFNDLANQVEAAQAQQSATAAAAPSAPASGPWGAIPQPSKGLPPGSTYTPSAPTAAVSGLPTPMSWADKALMAGGVGAVGVAPLFAIRNERRQQKAGDAAMERQRIDDMDAVALAAVRSGTQPFQSGTSTILPANPAADPNFDTPAAMPAMSRPAQTQRGAAPAMGSSGPAFRSQPQVPAAPAGGGSFLDKIFSGKDYQSSGGLLQQQQDGRRVLNWGDSDNAADFFRADAMRKRLADQGQDFTGASGSDIEYANRMSGEGKARGGAAEQKPSKEAMLHKSLEIIHHMIKNR